MGVIKHVALPHKWHVPFCALHYVRYMCTNVSSLKMYIYIYIYIYKQNWRVEKIEKKERNWRRGRRVCERLLARRTQSHVWYLSNTNNKMVKFFNSQMRSHYDCLCLMILNSMFGKKRNLTFLFLSFSGAFGEESGNWRREEEEEKNREGFYFYLVVVFIRNITLHLYMYSLLILTVLRLTNC